MLKTLKKWGAGLGLYFNKEEVKNYDLVEGKLINLDDKLIKKKKKK
jgi:hypothetical protein